MAGAYYNEPDPYAAEWLRNLILLGHIAPGDVDERSIEDVRPDDLRGYTQCHFFAGIGVWSYALRLAGWPDDRPVWTGSCPCQPFSQAGKSGGFADERHLWPAWQWLIHERRPPVVFGEQVASKAVEPWIDLVHADLEEMGYAFGCVPFPSAGVGAPHIRDRAYWVAYADDARSQGRQRVRERAAECVAGPGGVAGGVGVANGARVRGEPGTSHSEETSARDWQHGDGIGPTGATRGLEHPDGMRCAGRARSAQESGRELRQPVGGATSAAMRLVDANGRHASTERQQRGGQHGQFTEDRRIERIEPAGPTNGFWRDADWLFCRDEKWRPARSGSFPLVDGAPARMVRLRAYGNAINAQAAKAWIECVMEVLA